MKERIFIMEGPLGTHAVNTEIKVRDTFMLTGVPCKVTRWDKLHDDEGEVVWVQDSQWMAHEDDPRGWLTALALKGQVGRPLG